MDQVRARSALHNDRKPSVLHLPPAGSVLIKQTVQIPVYLATGNNVDIVMAGVSFLGAPANRCMNERSNEWRLLTLVGVGVEVGVPCCAVLPEKIQDVDRRTQSCNRTARRMDDTYLPWIDMSVSCLGPLINADLCLITTPLTGSEESTGLRPRCESLRFVEPRTTPCQQSPLRQDISPCPVSRERAAVDDRRPRSGDELLR
ncbi:hypothetical protein F5X97DRAFT_45154 [Nemania serpens]|nr:hypothetical protein F5X97DRAFT_45154 [Nemania serpens]